jgi:hypothetical protein
VGWNDRLPTDPYLPPEEYYRNGAEEYHAWLEYVETRLNEESGLTSQNIDPATITNTHHTEAPKPRGTLARIWAAIFGQNVSQVEEQKGQRNRQEENENLPF